MLEYISKQSLIDLMQQWGSGTMSTEDMSFWCCNNYFPGSQALDPAVSPCQQLAICDVLAAFEWQAHDDAITAKREGWQKAVEFLNCTEETFERTKSAFERECAGH